jgi:hypothetical protein
MTENPKISYSEVQRFSPLITMPFVLLFLVAIALEGHMILRPILETDEPWPNWALPVSIVGIVINILITLILVCTKLQTTIDSTGLYIRFFPFHLRFRRIDFDDIILIYPRTYQPLSEFGGYGLTLRFWVKSRAYNVSGKRGVQLEFVNGHKLLIGSQKAEEFTTALQEAVLHSRIAKTPAPVELAEPVEPGEGGEPGPTVEENETSAA